MTDSTLTLREGILTTLVGTDRIDATNAIHHMRDRIAKVQAITPLNIDTPFDMDLVDDILMRAFVGDTF